MFKLSRTRLGAALLASAAVCGFAPTSVAQANLTRSDGDGLDSDQAAAVAAVIRQADAQSDPSTPAQADRQEEALQPAVDKAVASGPGAVQALLATGDPVVASDLVTAADVTTTTTMADGMTTMMTRSIRPRTAGVLSHSTARPVKKRHARQARSATALPLPAVADDESIKRCWDAVSTLEKVNVGGVDLAWRRVTIGTWCSNSGYNKIVRNSGAYYDSWRAFLYCWNDPAENFGWDNFYWRLHARNRATLGGSFVWGCASLQTVRPGVRAYAGGFGDHVNDW